ncbi:unnamed protein product [Linum tenue]|uniref:Uncharacterized protein n=1 Tax=Linum tenue TaxID=586396 RepID=A0AAV0Q503_9ROSI|nr:unnamed protein product [Linum tenue]
MAFGCYDVRRRLRLAELCLLTDGVSRIFEFLQILGSQMQGDRV